MLVEMVNLMLQTGIIVHFTKILYKMTRPKNTITELQHTSASRGMIVINRVASSNCQRGHLIDPAKLFKNE